MLPLLASAIRLTLLAALLTGLAAPGRADPRAEFLQVIDRPRVALAATVGDPVSKDGVDTIPFSYASEDGQRVPGILIRPTGASPARHPVVIALHGTGGKKEGHAALLSGYAHSGFIGVAIDARYHGARVPTGQANTGNRAYNEAITRAYRTGREYPFFYDTVWDVMRLIDWLETLEDVDAHRIGLIGISKGGIEAYLAAAADPRIAVAVPCIGVQSFGWALEHDAWPARIATIQKGFDAAAAEAGVTPPDAAFVRRFYARVVPGIADRFDGPVMLPLIAPRPLLVINGDRDGRTPLPGLKRCTDAATAAYAAAGASDKFVVRLQADTGHAVTPASYAEAKAWFIRWLQP